ncbi:hypothetical protein AX15_005724 [Amanita polypyramis BW_CC]|nr:hypothetical protein AX15_005724 [Amanita polypyramis BW_CC]
MSLRPGVAALSSMGAHREAGGGLLGVRSMAQEHGPNLNPSLSDEKSLGKKACKVNNKNSFLTHGLRANLGQPTHLCCIFFIAIMNSVASSLPLAQNSSGPPYPRPPIDNDLRHLFSSASSPPPPSLREILTAYRAKGDGDREMLLTMLNAKAAEDQRIASVASLHRTALEVYQASFTDGGPSPLGTINGHPHIDPSTSFSIHQSEQNHCRHRHVLSRSSSPPRSHIHIPPIRDAPMSENATQHPRKRPRMSQSSPSLANTHEPCLGSHHDHLPPSPYSSSSRSDSAEYSPRSRASMAIGSLLSSGPKHVVDDAHDQE